MDRECKKRLVGFSSSGMWAQFGTAVMACLLVFSLVTPVAGSETAQPTDRTIETAGDTTPDSVGVGVASAASDSVTVGIVGKNFTGEIQDALENQLSSEYTFETVDSVPDPTTYDVLVVETLEGIDTQAFVDATSTREVGVVYLEQWGQQSTAITEFAGVSSSVGSTWQNDASQGDAQPPVDFVVDQTHSILKGLSEGDGVRIHTADYGDHAWFENTDFDVLASVKHATGDGGPALAIEENSGTVLAATLGYSDYVTSVDFTTNQESILANAVSYVVPEPPDFEIEGVTVPSEGETNETVTVSADINNTGDETGETTVTFDLNGNEMTSTVELSGGESTTVELDVTLPSKGGTYDWTLSAGNGEETGQIEVVAPAPAEFRITEVDIPSEVEPGRTIQVLINLTNVGDVAGKKEVSFSFDGTTVGSSTLEVKPGEDFTAAVDVRIPETGGWYDWRATAGEDEQTGQIKALDSSEFRIDSVDIPEKVDPGETVSIFINVTNVGDTTGTKEVAFELAGETVGSNTFPLDPGQTVNATMDVTMPDDGGLYNWRATAGGNERTGEIDVQKPAEFRVEDVTFLDSPRSGETVEVAIDVRNIGDLDGKQEVAFEFAGEEIERQAFELAGRESMRVTLYVTMPDDGGTYDWRAIAGEDEQTGRTDVEDVVPATFEIQDVRLPADGETGDRIEIEIDVENVGDEAGGKTVAFEFGNREVASDSITLDAGERTTITTRMTLPEDGGTYTWRAIAGDAETTGQFEVTEPEPATFEIGSVDVPAQTRTGETVDVFVNVTNTGDETGEKEVTFRFAGEEIATSTFELAPGKSVNATVDVTMPEDAGTYDWRVTAGEDETTGDIEVTAGPTARFVIESVDVPDEVHLGGTVQARINVTNVGEGAGEREVALVFEGQEIGSDTFELEPGETVSVVADMTVPEKTGTYDWRAIVGENETVDTIDVVDNSEFYMRNFDIPDEAEPGERVEISFEVLNLGEAHGEREVSFVFGDGEIAAETIELGAEERVTVTTTVTMPDDTGTYDWRAILGDKETESYIHVTEGEGATFAIDSVDIPDEAQPGDSIEAVVNVTNIGDEAGEKEIAFVFAGEEIGRKAFELDANENVSVYTRFTVPEDTGTYEWTAMAGNETESGDMTVADTTVDLSVGEASMKSGKTATVQLEADGETVAGYEVRLGFDADVVRITSVSGVDIDDPSADLDNDAGVLTVSANGMSALDEPVLATIEFEAVGDGAGKTRLSLVAEESEILDSDGETLELTVDDGRISVEPDCGAGDVNGDGDVTTADATLTQRYIAGLSVDDEFIPDCADVDENGEVTIGDVVQILTTVVDFEAV